VTAALFIGGHASLIVLALTASVLRSMTLVATTVVLWAALIITTALTA
jgi:hypothetical protein